MHPERRDVPDNGWAGPNWQAERDDKSTREFCSIRGANARPTVRALLMRRLDTARTFWMARWSLCPPHRADRPDTPARPRSGERSYPMDPKWREL